MQALWVLLASFFFATMSVGIKIAGASFSVSELLFYRGTVSVLFMAVLMRARRVSPQTTVPSLHLWRSLVGTLSLGTWFYAITHLPLATAMTLNYMSSIWIGAFVCGGAMLYRRSGRQGPLLATVLLGFVGVVMVLRPTLDQDQLFAGVIGLLSGLSAAIAYLQVTGLHAAGSQPPVHRHRAGRFVRAAAVRRPDSTAGLGRHGPDHGQRDRRDCAAHARPGPDAGRRTLTVSQKDLPCTPP
jgi:S-adenosylmethionine uptake transporter